MKNTEKHVQRTNTEILSTYPEKMMEVKKTGDTFE